jgi:formamidopyrimidine-DNA glycosylase
VYRKEVRVPELPEVEVVARGLNAALPGRQIVRAEILWERTVATPAVDEFVAQVVGRRFARGWRRGKFVVLDFEGGDHLLAHLRMTGILCTVPAGEPASPYVRARFELDNGCELRFTDTRKFGRLYLVRSVEEVTGRLGIEPLDAALDAPTFGQMLSRRRGRIKSLLLDQRFLAGLGNIYVDEALHRSGIHPLRPAASLSVAECGRLLDAIRSVLTMAIARGGTSFSTYRNAEGRPGDNQNFLAVYGRAGEACERCCTPIERSVVGQRGTHYCARCQPLAGESSAG